LWKLPGENRGDFDESTYDIDHIMEHSITADDSVDNLQALCKMCHGVATRRFMMEGREERKNKNEKICGKEDKTNKLFLEDNKLNKLLEEMEMIKQGHTILKNENNLINSKNTTVINNTNITINTNQPQMYQCPNCSKTYSSENILQDHIKNDCKKEYECNKCGKKFNRKYNLEVHHKKKFKCSLLKSDSEISSDIDNDIEVNNKLFTNINVEPFINTNTETPKNINADININNEALAVINQKKIFQCSICLRTYSSKCALRKHTKKKNCTKEKKINKCEYCSRVFTRSHVLKRHLNGNVLVYTKIDIY
jgi:predicted RNA-binding Zn-ribbon protein involved in translation (DUF1610 family)